MANENNFNDTVNSLFKGMDSFISAKTVVGEAIHIGQNKNNGGGGMTGKVTPSAVLVIQDGTTKLVNIKNQDGLTKVLDMVPDFVNRFSSKNAAAADGDQATEE